jgi:putative DNA primase/helicase
MSAFPDFNSYCEAACLKLWGEPDKRTAKEFRWNNGADGYGGRTYNIRKRAWYDHDQERGGSTLELVNYADGKPNEKLRGAEFFAAWKSAYERGWIPDPPPELGGGGKPILDTYPYPDEQGVLLYEVVRFDTPIKEERFKQRRPDGKQGWVWKTKGIRQVLYRLPQLIAAVKAGKRIVNTEGERDANTAVKLGYDATTNPGGVGKWRKDYDEFFRGADVVIIADNDDKGQAFAQEKAQRLVRIAAHVRVVTFAQKDLSEWVAAGGTREQLDAVIERTEEFKETEPEDLLPSPYFPMFVARVFVGEHCLHDGVMTLRYWRGGWWQWRRSHWSEREKDEVEAMLWVFTEYANYRIDGKIASWAPNAKKINDVFKALAAVVFLAPEVDQPTWLDGRESGTIVAVANGLLNVETRELIPHNPQFFNYAAVPFDYDKDAPRPEEWHKFLNALWPNDPASANVLGEWFGYVISGRLDLQKIFVMVGPTRGGRGVIARIETALIGKDNVAGPTLTSFGEPFGLQPLVGKSLAIISDARSGGGKDSSIVVERMLSISGEDALDINRKNRGYWHGKLGVRLHVISNELPRFADASGAIIGRLVVLLTTESWLGREDLDLERKLRRELSGILNFALDGLQRLTVDNKNKFTRLKAADEAIQQMRDLASPVGAFVREKCRLGTGDEYEVEVDTLYDIHKTWRVGNDYRRIDKGKFGRDLKAACPSVQKVRAKDETGRRYHVYRGIRLRTQKDDAEEGNTGPGEPGLSRSRIRELAVWYREQTSQRYSAGTLDTAALDAELRAILQEEVASPDQVEIGFLQVMELALAM